MSRARAFVWVCCTPGFFLGLGGGVSGCGDAQTVEVGKPREVTPQEKAADNASEKAFKNQAAARK